MLLIPPENMVALWNDDEALGIVEFSIADYNTQTNWDDRLDCSRGASCAGWMTGKPLDTPLGLFAELNVFPGFASDDIRTLALKEFTRVAGQDWAKENLSRAGVKDEEI